MTTSTPEPGWYDDPKATDKLRWWDGQTWSEQTRPRAPYELSEVGRPDPVVVPPATAAVADKSAGRKPWYRRWWAITAAVLIALAIVGSVVPHDEPSSVDAASSKAESDASSVTASASPSATTAVEPEPVDTDGDGVVDDEDYRPEDKKVQTQDDVDTDKDGVPDYKDAFPKDATYSKDADDDGIADQLDDFPKDARFSKDSDGDRVADSEDAFPQDPSKSKITLAMENALGAAQEYLDYSAFSRQGLIDQLSSEYGSGFAVADATWAVSQLKVDWKQQAVRAAKDYLDYSSFSRQGLIQQLSSPYGAQFTLEEATYAVNKIGL